VKQFQSTEIKQKKKKKKISCWGDCRYPMSWESTGPRIPFLYGLFKEKFGRCCELFSTKECPKFWCVDDKGNHWADILVGNDVKNVYYQFVVTVHLSPNKTELVFGEAVCLVSDDFEFQDYPTFVEYLDIYYWKSPCLYKQLVPT